MNVKRITRLLKLLQTLQSGNGRNADGLARDCGVSRRTVFRDLESLKAAGVPLSYDTGLDRYSIPGSYFLPPINFTAAEALSLLALSGEMGRGDRLPFYEPAQAAATKLTSCLPGALREELRSMVRTIRIRPSAVTQLELKRTIYEQLVDARAARRAVRIAYESLTEWERITTKLRPYYLFFCKHSWFVIGRSSVHGEVRTFNLSRITSLEMLSERFNVPKGFSLERHLGNAWMMIPGDGPDHQVEIRFKPLVAQNVAEVLWHKTQQVEFEDGGSLLFRAKVSGLNEIVWWILGYGDQAEVLRPTKLRHLVAQRAKKMAEIYNGKEL